MTRPSKPAVPDHIETTRAERVAAALAISRCLPLGWIVTRHGFDGMDALERAYRPYSGENGEA